MLNNYERSGTHRIDAKTLSFVAAGMELAEVLSILDNTFEKTTEEREADSATERTQKVSHRNDHCAEWACAVMRVGWRTSPTPAPTMMRIRTIFHVARVRLKRRTSPSPRVQSAKPV